MKKLNLSVKSVNDILSREELKKNVGGSGELNMLRKIILGSFIIFVLSSARGQVVRSETFVLDYNSKQFIRILDGLKLDSVDSVGRSQLIGQVFRSSDNFFFERYRPCL